MRSFADITEIRNKDKPPIRLLIVSAKNDSKLPFITAGRLQKECKKKGLDSYIVHIEEAVIDKQKDVTTILRESSQLTAKQQ